MKKIIDCRAFKIKIGAIQQGFIIVFLFATDTIKRGVFPKDLGFKQWGIYYSPQRGIIKTLSEIRIYAI